MLPRLLSSASALSLVLCLTTLALWVGSYSVAEQVAATRACRYTVGVSGGQLTVEKSICQAIYTGEDGPALVPVDYSVSWRFTLHPPPPNINGEGDPDWGGAPSRPNVETRAVLFTVPVWLVTACLALPPLALFLGRLWKRSRRSEGHCAKCGYDMRATPNRCPECGSSYSETMAAKV